ncbi:hypothetical protein FTV88_2897 [Heliorestis convoluta]|uniref:Uncharacterized protein n=1 Tax=Heliorestis convoluta TaxID=356322 RepID=A0A5Q2N5T1_9FIRM|nr:hypothetical protein FTV88_2897 [Heliorestis convoluta]
MKVIPLAELKLALLGCIMGAGFAPMKVIPLAELKLLFVAILKSLSITLQ